MSREEEDAVVVGWPPVKSWTKKQGGGSKYVKVEKEGIGIGRKIDLSSHRSYESLTPTLMAMFGNRTLLNYFIYQLQKLAELRCAN